MIRTNDARGTMMTTTPSHLHIFVIRFRFYMKPMTVLVTLGDAIHWFVLLLISVMCIADCHEWYTVIFIVMAIAMSLSKTHKTDINSNTSQCSVIRIQDWGQDGDFASAETLSLRNTMAGCGGRQDDANMRRTRPYNQGRKSQTFWRSHSFGPCYNEI